MDLDESFQELVKLGDFCRFTPKELLIGNLAVRLIGSRSYESKLKVCMEPQFLDLLELRRAATAVKLLYQVSSPIPLLPEDNNFRNFVSLLSESKTSRMICAELSDVINHLIGYGSGFTPSGDDFIAGFAAAFNYLAQWSKSETFELTIADVSHKTVRESALLLWYATRGYVDEES